jgi:hypothetical protein
MSRAVILALCLGAASASSGFTNVTHLKTATIAFGASSSNDGVDAFFPASDGSSVGVYISNDGGDDLNYMDGVGATAEAAILMATAVRDVDADMSVIVGGLFGAAISFDAGKDWQKLNIPEIVTQDIKYESGSGLYSLTGASLGVSGAMLSSNGGLNFTMVPVTGLYEPYLRYGSYPTTKTFYVTAGIWGDSVSSENTKKHISARLSISNEGKLIRHEVSDTNSTGYWAQVAKSSDAGETWSIVFEDFESDRYPNDISCYDENTCVFVMEGMGVPQILSTQDGGNTWTIFNDESGGVSLMAARMYGPTEAWVSGGGDVGRMWHTTDLKTWTAYTTDMNDAAEIMSFDFNADQTMAFATGVLRSQLCDMLKLDF